jgi:hypothetical protein
MCHSTHCQCCQMPVLGSLPASEWLMGGHLISFDCSARALQAKVRQVLH